MEMGGNKIFDSWAKVFYFRPIAEVEFGFFEEASGDVFGPRFDAKAEVKFFEDFDPAPDGGVLNADFFRKL